MQVRDGVEFGYSTLGAGVKAFGFAAHLEEDLLLLELPCELVLERLRGAAETNIREAPVTKLNLQMEAVRDGRSQVKV